MTGEEKFQLLEAIKELRRSIMDEGDLEVAQGKVRDFVGPAPEEKPEKKKK